MLEVMLNDEVLTTGLWPHIAMPFLITLVLDWLKPGYCGSPEFSVGVILSDVKIYNYNYNYSSSTCVHARLPQGVHGRLSWAGRLQLEGGSGTSLKRGKGGERQ